MRACLLSLPLLFDGSLSGRALNGTANLSGIDLYWNRCKALTNAEERYDQQRTVEESRKHERLVSAGW